MIPIVVITDISRRTSYYQWFIYGLMLLEKEGIIKLRIRTPLIQRLYFDDLLYNFIRIWKRMRTPKPENKLFSLFHGYVEYNGKVKTFCIDSADSPYMFYGKYLKEVDTYFKLQCPIEIEKDGFRLGNVTMPYVDNECYNQEDNGKIKAKRKLCPDVWDNRDKIKPLLVPIRKMGRNCSFKILDACYKNLMIARGVSQTQKAMCYFGDAKGPVPSEDLTNVDLDWEADIMALYKNELNHPNEKRAKIAEILKSLGRGYDARIINPSNSDGNKDNQNESLVIPFEEFSKHVAKFQYNINVSGYRMSIPGRFMDSFVCGTAIATDNLHVKWYAPFDNEVVEIGEMGYLPDNEVDYPSIKERLSALPDVSRDCVIEKYEKYWAPNKCAEYIVRTVIGHDFICR